MDLKAKLLYDLLIVSHLEGEDLSLNQVVEALMHEESSYKDLLELLKHELGDMPPRVVFAKLHKLSFWQTSLHIAAKRYLEDHLLASLDKKLDNWRRICKAFKPSLMP